MIRRPNFAHVNEFRDRFGRVRRYVRRHGKSVRLDLNPDDPGYIAEYQAALAKLEPVPYRSDAGSWDALADEYLESAKFLGLSKRNQGETRREILRIRAKWGDKPVAAIEARHVEKWQDELADTPGKANNVLSTVKKLLSFAVRRGYRKDNPALGINKLKLGEHRSWTDDELERFEAKWKIGTRERLIYALALHTGQRKGDLLAMTWGQVGEDGIRVAQGKTGARLRVPVHSELAAVLDKLERGKSTDRLLPIQSRHAGTIMMKAIKKALGKKSGCVLHGLRRSAARRLAEVGCSAHEIMAITGHTTLAMVQKYTREAGQLGLAKTAMAKLKKGPEKEGNGP